MKQNRYGRCRFPGCDGNLLPGKSKEDLCIRHTEQLRFIAWALENILLRDESKTSSGIILPRKEV